MLKADWIEHAAYEAHRLAATTHPADVQAALSRAFEREENELPKFVMKAIVDNSHVAREDQRPICADVGVPRVYVVAGNEAGVDGGFVALEQAIRRATVRVTKGLALRSNRVHPISRADPGNNLGVFAPNIEYRFEPDADWVELVAVHKGGAFGSDFRMMVDGDGPETNTRLPARTTAESGMPDFLRCLLMPGTSTISFFISISWTLVERGVTLPRSGA